MESVLIFVGIIIYFVPVFIAFSRKHRSKAGISALCVLLGWTFIGWIAALIWSLSYTHNQEAEK
jgi:uncharacterized membrane protein